MAILATVVGLAGGLGAIGFRYLITLIQRLAYGGGGNLLDLVNAIPWYQKVWVPAAGGLVVGPLVYYHRFRRFGRDFCAITLFGCHGRRFFWMGGASAVPHGHRSACRL